MYIISPCAGNHLTGNSSTQSHSKVEGVPMGEFIIGSELFEEYYSLLGMKV